VRKEREIVINRCWGGFGLSQEAIRELKRLGCPHLVEYDEEEFFKWEKENGSWREIWKNLSWEDYKRKQMRFLGLIRIGGKLVGDGHGYEDRDCEKLVKVVKKLGIKACGRFANLKIVKIPADVEWEIDNYDGMETVEEKHRRWS
jgi:hypothetical protein